MADQGINYTVATVTVPFKADMTEMNRQLEEFEAKVAKVFDGIEERVKETTDKIAEMVDKASKTDAKGSFKENKEEEFGLMLSDRDEDVFGKESFDVKSLNVEQAMANIKTIRECVERMEKQLYQLPTS